VLCVVMLEVITCLLISLVAVDVDGRNAGAVGIGLWGGVVEVGVLGIFERLRRVVCEVYAFVDLVICVALVLILGLFDIGLLMTVCPSY